MTPNPTTSGHLPEQDGHQVWYAAYGNPEGPTILMLHGGPGSKSKPKYLAGYDLEKYQVVMFDQRGCGQSLPAGQLEHNTTQDLVADMERLRTALEIDTWFVMGASWASTLALVYAQQHPQSVRGLLLSSIFLARPRDNNWVGIQPDGIGRIFPDLLQRMESFLQRQNVSPSANVAQELLAKLETADETTTQEIVAGYSDWEANLMYAFSDVAFNDPDDISEQDIASTKIFLHYEANHFFLEPDQIMKQVEVIKDIPAVLVHGRYDLLCPVEQLWELQQQLTSAETVILPTSNHRLTAEGKLARQLAFNFFLHRQAAEA